MPSQPKFTEWMIYQEISGYRLRCWFDAGKITKVDARAAVCALAMHIQIDSYIDDMLIRAAAMELPHVTAFEITNHLGNGEVCYMEWP